MSISSCFITETIIYGNDIPNTIADYVNNKNSNLIIHF